MIYFDGLTLKFRRGDSASSIRYAHRMHNDTMPFTLVRSGTTCTLKREGTTAITYKVYGIA